MVSGKHLGTTSHYRVVVGEARRFVRAHATEPLTLAQIAGVAGVSPFHFARIFAAVTGETLFHYVQRLRLRLAAEMLLEDPEARVTDIALRVGYSTPSSFNRVFKRFVGMAPTRFRARRSWKLLVRLDPPRRRRQVKLDISPKPAIRVRDDRPFVHVRRLGPYADEAPRAWSDLHQALTGASFVAADSEFVGVCHDDSETVPESALRYDAGVTVTEGIPALPGTELGTLRGGRYAVFRYRGSYSRLGQAFEQVFGGWVVTSGVKLREAPCLECI